MGSTLYRVIKRARIYRCFSYKQDEAYRKSNSNIANNIPFAYIRVLYGGSRAMMNMDIERKTINIAFV